MLGFVLFVVWMWPAVRSDAATSSELEQSIKEKESAISQAQEEKKTAAVHHVQYTGYGRQPGKL